MTLFSKLALRLIKVILFTVFIGINCLAQIFSTRIDVGVRGGASMTDANATIPVQYSFILNNQLSSQSNGHGIGYSVGLFARFKSKNLRNYIQVDVSVISSPIKQKFNTPISIDKALTSLIGLPAIVIPSFGNTTINITSAPVIKSIEVPIQVGRYFLSNRFRISAGPSLLFFYQTDLLRNISGQMNLDLANTQLTIPVTSALVQQLKINDVLDLKPKPISWGFDAEVGAALLPFLDVNLLYDIPVGGIFEKANITGYYGTLTLAVNWQF